ncbi:hypothetical protein C455_12043 [Haloferax larsenii JCM 13917]|nr:hypothetical protein [Haloferax larsenii]ELZ78414.1 hypothetical protein C455_12043 [Haloferax larsenii JCM 13917]
MATRPGSHLFTTSSSTTHDAPTETWRFWAGTAATNPRVLTFATLAVVSLGLLPLYESIWWWDIAMHAACSAALVVWLYRIGVSPVAALVFLFSIGIAWEVLEAATPHFVLMAGGWEDTVGDVVSNTSGWVVATVAQRWISRVDDTLD